VRVQEGWSYVSQRKYQSGSKHDRRDLRLAVAGRVRNNFGMGRTQLELFRSGNANSARLHMLRLPSNHPRPEIETFIEAATGDEWVRANTGGASTDEAADPNWRGPAHRLPAGTDYPDELGLTLDGPGHWLWEPSRDMPLVDYVNALETVNGHFQKV
jgi:hypothetical protein